MPNVPQAQMLLSLPPKTRWVDQTDPRRHVDHEPDLVARTGGGSDNEDPRSSTRPPLRLSKAFSALTCKAAHGSDWSVLRPALLPPVSAT